MRQARLNIIPQELRADRVEILETLKYLTPVEGGVNFLRVGGANDGGYLVPDDLGGIRAVFHRASTL